MADLKKLETRLKNALSTVNSEDGTDYYFSTLEVRGAFTKIRIRSRKTENLMAELLGDAIVEASELEDKSDYKLEEWLRGCTQNSNALKVR